MGLAQKKIRSKLGRDPNNTNWSQNTTRFGHKVLVSQGWIPGGTLGVPDSKYAGSHYTAASSSHVRVVVKDDNLGLGARTGRPDRDETFGLELLSGLLGRLNGKEEVVLQKEQAARRDVKLMSYHEKKWGTSRFVFGGYLVGDEIQDVLEKIDEAEKSKQKKNKKKRKRSEEESASETQKKPTQSESTSEDIVETEVEQKLTDKLVRKEEKRRRKEEKKARKEAKRLKRQQREEAKEDSNAQSSTPSSDQDISQIAHGRNGTSIAPSSAASGASTPLFTPRGRQAIRQRYIQQKRMAVLDEKALQEILMIKKS